MACEVWLRCRCSRVSFYGMMRYTRIMTFENRVVAFIDILGFEHAIDATIGDDGVQNEGRIDAIEDALIEVSKLLEPSQKLFRRIKGYRGEPSLVVTQFSDSIVASIRADDPAEVFASIQSIYWIPVQLMRLAGLSCRGGIGFGLARHTESVLFGPAVIQAYQLESKAANYPRIVIHPSVHSLLEDARERILLMEGLRLEDVLAVDEDGLHYINYFKLLPNVFEGGEWGEYQVALQEVVREGLESRDPGIMAKYMWMQSKMSQQMRVADTITGKA